jgi:RNA methyltransferase, TrmH family
MDYTKGSAFLIGNEGNGLKEETAKAADSYVKIPMHGQLESLNAAIAGTLFMYEAEGQRRKKAKGE